ncbi:MAG: signal recognition particle-docking protein FtsY [Nanoarchaeota archaeon]|nr:signal recognition particle-docking protein FtsY [Nanoarchaeota archaeon]
MKKKEIKPKKVETQEKTKKTETEDKKEEEVPEPKEEVIEEPEVKEEEVVAPEPVKSFFAKTKEIFTTKKITAEKFDDLFWQLELVLLEHNVAVGVIERIKDDLKEELVDKPLPLSVSKKVESTLKKTVLDVLTVDSLNIIDEIKKKDEPYVIACFGINGSGKTTTVAKLAHLLKRNGLTSVMAASDTFRAAAIQQLEEHGKNLDIRVIKHDYGADAAAVAYDAISHAKKHDIDVVLIDTAGRLHSNVNLMDELQKLCRVTSPDLNLFLGEAITGNDCIEQAQKFDEHVGIHGIIMTKADIDEKGGTPLSISYITKKPIFFLGVGQGYEDLEVFDKNKIIEKLAI